jgi:hypothetical protein
VRLPASNDSRLLLAGVAASLALLAYLAAAFANTHASAPLFARSGTDPFAPWTPKYHSTLAPASRRKGGGIAIHAARGWIGAYGAVVPTIASQPPPGHRIVVNLWLRGFEKAPIEVLVDEFPAGPKIVDTTVPATRRWHHYTFSAPIKGRWLGLGMYVGSSTNGVAHKWFAVRGLTAKVR